MPRAIIMPPLDKFAGAAAQRLLERWWIDRNEVARKAGVPQRRINSWLKGRIARVDFPETGAVYDALFEIVERQARWAVREIERLKEQHRGR